MLVVEEKSPLTKLSARERLLLQPHRRRGFLRQVIRVTKAIVAFFNRAFVLHLKQHRPKIKNKKQARQEKKPGTHFSFPSSPDRFYFIRNDDIPHISWPKQMTYIQST